MIKGVEIQTLLSCQLSERNFFFSLSLPSFFQMPQFVVGVRLLCAHRQIRIMGSERCIHSADNLDPAMLLTAVLQGLCVLITFRGNTQSRVVTLVS